MQQQLPGYYTPGEIANQLGCSRQFIIDCITGRGGERSPSLKAYKLHRYWLVPEEIAHEFVRLHQGY